MSFAIEAPNDGKLHVKIPYQYKGVPLTATEIEDGTKIDLESNFQCKISKNKEANEKVLPDYELKPKVWIKQ